MPAQDTTRLQRLTGRHYALALDQLNTDALQEPHRVVRDVAEEQARMQRRLRFTPFG